MQNKITKKSIERAPERMRKIFWFGIKRELDEIDESEEQKDVEETKNQSLQSKYPRLKRRGFIGEQHDAKELGIHPQAKASGFLPRGNKANPRAGLAIFSWGSFVGVAVLFAALFIGSFIEIPFGKSSFAQNYGSLDILNTLVVAEGITFLGLWIAFNGVHIAKAYGFLLRLITFGIEGVLMFLLNAYALIIGNSALTTLFAFLVPLLVTLFLIGTIEKLVEALYVLLVEKDMQTFVELLGVKI